MTRPSLHETASDWSPLTIVVADDHPLFRAGIVRALEEDPRFELVGEAADGTAAERIIVEHDPVLALLDLQMPGRGGLDLLARLRHHEPPVAIVVLTSYSDAELVHSAMDAGAAGYVTKETGRDEILEVLIDAALGRRRVVAADAHEAKAPRPRLSARERSVLAMLNRGWSPEEIAMLASMTPSTVEAHIASARRKLAALTTADAIAAAEAWGLLHPEP
jgi:two-component system nitrate/nitrite response regulator NarL